MTNIFNDQEMVFMFFGIVIMVAVLVVRYFLKDSNVIGQQNPQSDAEMEARIAKRRLNNYSVEDAEYWDDFWKKNDPTNPSSAGYIYDPHYSACSEY